MPWDPVHDLLTMQERLESLFGRTTACWMPPADLAELPDRYVLTVELPGLGREDVHVDLDEGTLTVRGTRPGPGCPSDRYQQLERGQGEFSRVFRFGAPVVAGGITADLADGVLTVVVPKLIENRRIDVE
jgi:HSP20 family protein